jgi:hypothetical protein
MTIVVQVGDAGSGVGQHQSSFQRYAGLSLAAEHRCGHGAALYDAVNAGRVQIGRLQPVMAGLPAPGRAGPDRVGGGCLGVVAAERGGRAGSLPPRVSHPSGRPAGADQYNDAPMVVLCVQCTEFRLTV